METRNWIIVDVDTEQALYGAKEKTLRFSTRAIAYEVARQMFNNEQRFVVLNLNTLNK